MFDDGWVEVPTFGRAFSAMRGNVRTTLLTLLAGVVCLAVAVGAFLLANRSDGVLAGALRVVGGLLFVAALLLLGIRSFQVRRRQRARWIADGQDLQRMRAAGELPGRAPGAPLWRRARTAEQFASWLTRTTLVRAVDVSVVTPLPELDGEHGVEVRLHSGAVLRYRSPDRALVELLTGFGATATAG